MAHKIFSMPVAEVYPHYVTKLAKKERTEEELREVMRWLTGYSDEEIDQHLEDRTSFEDFFAAATLHNNAPKITGVICGVRVEEIEDPLMQQIRMLDKLVDELARGKAMEKVLRS